MIETHSLLTLFSDIDGLRIGDWRDVPVLKLVVDSRQVVAGSVFVAICGLSHDGHNLLSTLDVHHLSALVVEHTDTIPASFLGAILVVTDSKRTLNLLASRYNLDPAHQLKMIGVTGTNGKTTTTHMIEWILNSQKFLTGVMGTINHHVGEKVWTSQLTTPDTLTFYQRLRDFVDLGAKAATMEISSHALKQKRVDQVPFDVAVFTNLSRDHLDYHLTMEDYFLSKEILFSRLLEESPKSPKYAVINAEDNASLSWAKKLRVAPSAKLISYSSAEEVPWIDRDHTHFYFRLDRVDFSGQHVFVRRSFKVLGTSSTASESASFVLPMIGIFNLENAVASIAAAWCVGVSLSDAAQAMAKFYGVKGRLQPVPNTRELNVFVDFAHTDQALATVLGSLRHIKDAVGGKPEIWTIFGCGGQRDHGKRPLMGKVTQELSDHVIVTSDNPRDEDPNEIIRQICSELDPAKKNVVIEADRRKAMAIAFSQAKKGDVILIAGKGHETEQYFANSKTSFDDYYVAQELMA